mmetsp:Transcript_9345/g.17257  ORF Transcript_9345/g.17257 Transcript_9345/m.17257 type:complete len:212 (+) Transcript_9345:119-754(+)
MTPSRSRSRRHYHLRMHSSTQIWVTSIQQCQQPAPCSRPWPRTSMALRRSSAARAVAPWARTARGLCRRPRCHRHVRPRYTRSNDQQHRPRGQPKLPWCTHRCACNLGCRLRTCSSRTCKVAFQWHQFHQACSPRSAWLTPRCSSHELQPKAKVRRRKGETQSPRGRKVGHPAQWPCMSTCLPSAFVTRSSLGFDSRTCWVFWASSVGRSG